MEAQTLNGRRGEAFNFLAEILQKREKELYDA
jgi:hemoglobin-like flavoprotein